ncbi:hypothetical protein ABID08_000760 [Rhizobium binae]|uniref:Uncharacterized protein n=1 Tax=Rhizobium binae TaxID=1138190 RepID=A0ABV2MAC9_9HYPH
MAGLSASLFDPKPYDGSLTAVEGARSVREAVKPGTGLAVRFQR